MDEKQLKNTHYLLLDELNKASNALTKKKPVIDSKPSCKTLTFKKYECFLRLYFGSKISICIRTNTLNSQEMVSWDYCNNISSVTDIDEYAKITLDYVKNLVFIWDNITYTPERHKEPLPYNHGDIKKLIGDEHWTVSYESLMMYPCRYANKEYLMQWLDIVTDKQFRKDIKPI